MPGEAPRFRYRRWLLQCGSLLAVTGTGLGAAAFAETGNNGREQKEPAPTYVDRLINDGKLEPITSTSEEKAENSKGNPRSIVVELGGSRIAPRSLVNGVVVDPTNRVQDEVGIAISGRYQTTNYGLLGIDGQLRRGTAFSAFTSATPNRVNGSITVSSHGLPLGDGWLADSALGSTTTPMIPLMRRQTRFYLPSSPIMGGAISLRAYDRYATTQGSIQPEPFATFNLSVGEPGLLGGLRLSDFSGLNGLSLSAGGQISLSRRLTLGTQAIAVRDTRDPYAAVFTASPSINTMPLTSSQAAATTLAYADGGLRVQANTIWSHRTSTQSQPGAFGRTGHAGGGWVDASYRSGKTSHSGGFYYLGPGLSWGTSAVLNNVYGGYYRFATSTQRWRWTVNIDALDSIDGQGASGVIVNGDVRRKLSFNTAIGINGTFRAANGQNSAQMLGFVDFTTKLGGTRAEVGWSHDPSTDLYRLGLNQNWELPVWFPSGSRLSTQVSFEHRRQSPTASGGANGLPKDTANSFGLALSAGATPFSGIQFDATMAYRSNNSVSAASLFGPVDGTAGALGILSTQQGQAFSASVVATARLSSSWSLLASYTDTTSNLTTQLGLPAFNPTPLGPLPGQIAALQRTSYRLRAGYLTLRYSASAGRQSGVLGARQFPVGGTGRIEGRVYLDANNNRSREPSESGVGGIVVILDGLQAVRTDQSGYYLFENVADGPHRITLNADMLPLPWTIEPEGKRGTGAPYQAEIDVGVRSAVTLDIAASKD